MELNLDKTFLKTRAVLKSCLPNLTSYFFSHPLNKKNQDGFTSQSTYPPLKRAIWTNFQHTSPSEGKVEHLTAFDPHHLFSDNDFLTSWLDWFHSNSIGICSKGHTKTIWVLNQRHLLVDASNAGNQATWWSHLGIFELENGAHVLWYWSLQ